MIRIHSKLVLVDTKFFRFNSTVSPNDEDHKRYATNEANNSVKYHIFSLQWTLNMFAVAGDNEPNE